MCVCVGHVLGLGRPEMSADDGEMIWKMIVWNVEM